MRAYSHAITMRWRRILYQEKGSPWVHLPPARGREIDMMYKEGPERERDGDKQATRDLIGEGSEVQYYGRPQRTVGGWGWCCCSMMFEIRGVQ